MIRINLLGEKVDRTGTYMLQLVAYIGCVVLTLAGCFAFYGATSSELDSLTEEKGMLERRLAKLEKETKEVDDLEKKRGVLKEKLNTIALLKARKQGPVKVLDNINSAIPERAWLKALKEKGGVLEIDGIALDNQTVAQFMKNLEQQKTFGTVDLVESSEFVKDEVKLKQFILSVVLTSPVSLHGASSSSAGAQASSAASAPAKAGS